MLIRVSASDFAVLPFEFERGWDFAIRRLGTPLPSAARINRISGESRSGRGDREQRTNDVTRFRGSELVSSAYL